MFGALVAAAVLGLVALRWYPRWRYGAPSRAMVRYLITADGGDITLDYITRAVDSVHEAAQGKPWQEVTFLDLE